MDRKVNKLKTFPYKKQFPQETFYLHSILQYIKAYKYCFRYSLCNAYSQDIRISVIFKGVFEISSNTRQRKCIRHFLFIYKRHLLCKISNVENKLCNASFNNINALLIFNATIYYFKTRYIRF